MTEDKLKELYQEILLKHSKAPMYYGKLPVFTHHAEGFNPICGDAITVYLNLEGRQIKAASFESASCSICNASASMMLQEINLKALNQVLQYHSSFETLLINEEFSEEVVNLSEEFKAFLGLSKFPARKACALLPWETLKKALK